MMFNDFTGVSVRSTHNRVMPPAAASSYSAEILEDFVSASHYSSQCFDESDPSASDLIVGQSRGGRRAKKNAKADIMCLPEASMHDPVHSSNKRQLPLPRLI